MLVVVCVSRLISRTKQRHKLADEAPVRESFADHFRESIGCPSVAYHLTNSYHH